MRFPFIQLKLSNTTKWRGTSFSKIIMINYCCCLNYPEIVLMIIERWIYHKNQLNITVVKLKCCGNRPKTKYIILDSECIDKCINYTTMCVFLFCVSGDIFSSKKKMLWSSTSMEFSNNKFDLRSTCLFRG